MSFVSEFLYRLPRFDVMFPIEFVQDGTPDGSIAEPATAGRCLNLSNTGLLALFVYPLGEGTVGMLRLKPASRTFVLRAVVTHSEGMRAGLKFSFASDQERQVIRALVDTIASRSTQPR